MKHKRVTWVAIGVLVVVAAAAYHLANTGSLVPALADGKGDVRIPATDAKVGAKDKGGSAAGAATAGPGRATPVEVIVVRPVNVQEELQAVGSMRSNESVVLRPEVAGRIATIGFRDGQAVRKGQLLIGLDASLNEAEVAQYQAEYDLALSNLKRSEDLARQKFISSSARETAASNAQVAEARLKLAQVRLSKMRIVAPFDGVVGIRGVSLGDYVKDGTDLVNVEDVRNLKVDFRLPERNLAQVKVGQGIEVVADALPDERWQGEIEAINPRIEPNGRSLELRARVDNARGSLRPGMFARVRVIVGQRSNALIVPEESIVPQGGQFFVYKVVDGTARRVPVKLGVRRDARVEILEGIAAGDQVVTAGMRLSRDGQPVQVLPTEDGAPNGDAPKGNAPKGNQKNAAGDSDPAMGRTGGS
jgi:membrane fusion protein (multidrug efflux system)